MNELEKQIIETRFEYNRLTKRYSGKQTYTEDKLTVLIEDVAEWMINAMRLINSLEAKIKE
jgi:hypothetical protein